ncbi:MAG TPA: type VI secretion system tip protein TssI/VgrG, partial [Polyangiaceae bacterium]
FKTSLSASYSPRTFVVQYRETDLNFVSRLMEQEGIYFFTKHTAAAHEITLADSYSAHDPTPGYEEIQFLPPDPHRKVHVDHIHHWDLSEEIEPGAYAHTDFDFEKPTANLLQTTVDPGPYAMSHFEVYDYPGGYLETPAGEAYARIRMEELQATSERAEAQSNARGIAVGSLFTLTNFPRDDQNREYLIISAECDLRTHDPRSASEGETVFRCGFSVTPSARAYRPPRRARKAIVQGVQTATVVGHAGAEIWTDNYGRVKVKFHWDRAPGADENSSCWVRVAQLWAGTGFGGIHIPRIGQEVIVEFLEGDPDRPLVTGRVYNARNPVPYTLPANQTQSGIKSRSSKGGDPSNFNELRFEDKKGSEQVYFQAEKNLDTLVKASESHSVGSDRTITVGNNETHTVTNNRTKTVNNSETVTVAVNRTETVGSNEIITIGSNRTESVGSMETITIGAARTTTVIAAETLMVGAAQTIVVGAIRSVTVGGAEMINVGAARSVDVMGGQSTSVGGSRSTQVGGSEDVTIGGGRSQSVGKNDTVKVANSLAISAGDEIVLETGDASIVLKKSGDITIKGKNITIEGSGSVTIKAKSDMTLKGSKISQNG